MNVYASHLDSVVLKCNVTGNPSNCTYGQWTHLSSLGTYIRTLNGSGSGAVKLLTITNVPGNVYELAGIYVCNASNGIKGRGQLWATGSVKVKIKGSKEDRINIHLDFATCNSQPFI